MPETKPIIEDSLPSFPESWKNPASIFALFLALLAFIVFVVSVFFGVDISRLFI